MDVDGRCILVAYIPRLVQDFVFVRVKKWLGPHTCTCMAILALSYHILHVN